MITLQQVFDTPIGPDRLLAQTILAGVFNRNITAVDTLNETEAVTILAAKVLKDTGYEIEIVQVIMRWVRPLVQEHFRHWREEVYRALKDAEGLRFPLVVLNICNNRYVTVLGPATTLTGYDFRSCRRYTPTAAPLLTMSINLSKLLQIVAGTDPNGPYYSSLSAEIEAARREGQDGP